MAEEDTIYAFQHECGVCADYSNVRGWRMLKLLKSYRIPWKPNIWLRMPQDSDKPKGNIVAGPLVVNMVEHNNSSRYNDNKGKCKHHDTRANPNKKACWKCGKPGHLKKDCKAGNVGNRANGSSTKGSEDGSSNPLKCQSMFNKSYQIYYVTYVSEAFFVQDDDVAWWVDSRPTVHVCKDRCWFKTDESLNDGSILHMRNESTALVYGRGCAYLRLNIVFDNIGSAFMSTSKLNDSILWHARLGYVHFKRMQDMSKDGLIPTIDMDTEKCKTCMLNKITKKPFQNVKRKTKVLELINSDLCDLHVTPSLGNKKYFVTFIDDASRFYWAKTQINWVIPIRKPNDSCQWQLPMAVTNDSYKTVIVEWTRLLVHSNHHDPSIVTIRYV
nr:zinc finger, CCHC-type [Tanacetum cinerariifolium]